MSELSALIDQLCPSGVEYKTLGEVARIERGNGLSKSEFVENGVPCIHYGQLYTRFNTVATKTLTYVAGEIAAALKRLHQGDVLMAVTSENIEDVCKCITWLGDGDVVVGGHTAIIRHILNPKYLAYWFQTYEFFVQKRKLAHGTKVIEVTPSCLSAVELPVPPLPVQQEIVRRLDAMTGLIADLEKELAARQKQYEWVCEETFKQLEAEGVERKKLGEIASDVYRGNGILRTQVTDSGVECVRYGEIYTEYNVWFEKCVSHTRLKYVTSPKSFEHGDILFAITGEKVEEIGKCVAYVGMESCLAGGDIVVMKHSQDAKYLAYALSTHDAQAQKSRGKVKSKVVHSSVPELKQVLVPVPPLPIQQTIVRRLDEMTGLIAAIEKEIALRKQQYEYYRDKLLTFKRAG